jgi:hypothetical protein
MRRGLSAKRRSHRLFGIRLSTDITNSFFIDDTNTAAIAAQFAFGEIVPPLLDHYRISTPAAIMTLVRYFPFTFGTDEKR